ncbi:TPA: hypothetical protein KD020_003822 [Vibrio parahaemolyticus]|nr:hypothetical protein [Vibrio parahaemolyticus]HBC3544478.1 hypothetical protein [Vibrio parahaemolyticus]
MTYHSTKWLEERLARLNRDWVRFPVKVQLQIEAEMKVIKAELAKRKEAKS